MEDIGDELKTYPQNTQNFKSNTQTQHMSQVRLSQRDYVPIIKGVEYDTTLGQGSFAFVKLAHLKKNPAKTFAIKFINRNYCHKFGLKDDDISRELMIHKSCNGHPNIIQLYDAGSDRNYMWMIMELASSGDLFDKIEPDVGVDEEIAHFYFKQLVGAIDFIHKVGVSHRDIKPENILLDKYGNLKIADFGLACVYRKKTGEKRLAFKACGSPPYMAPEVVNVEGYRPEVTDIWSCGVLLYVLLTGETLWEEPTTHDPDFKYFVENSNRIYLSYPWSKLKTEIIALLKALLKINPEERITLERVRKHPWVNRPNKLSDSKGLCDNPRLLIRKLMANLRIDLSDDEFFRTTQQATQQATQMSQAFSMNGAHLHQLANSQPVFESAKLVVNDNSSNSNAVFNNNGSSNSNDDDNQQYSTGFLNTQQDFSEYGRKINQKLDRKDNDLLRYQMISKDPAILQFINESDKSNLLPSLQNLQDNGNGNDGSLATVKNYFNSAERLTRFFSILPIESLLSIILDALHQAGVQTDFASDGVLSQFTEKKFTKRLAQMKAIHDEKQKQLQSDGASTSKFNDGITYASISIHTIDSRKMTLRGSIKIAKIRNITLKKIEFAKSKGDPLEWRKFFKKITVLCRDAVYVDQSLK